MSVRDHANGPAMFGLFELTIFYKGFSWKPIVIDALRVNKQLKETYDNGLNQTCLNHIWVGYVVRQIHRVRSVVNVGIDTPRERNILPKARVF